MAIRELFVIVIFTLFALSAAAVDKRTVKTTLFPDCWANKHCQDKILQNATWTNASFPNLAYTRAAAGDDVLHFVMTTINLPSILVVHTTNDKNANLHFDWDRLLLQDNMTDMSGAINTTGHTEYSFIVVFSRLIEYDDVHDTASLTEAEKKGDALWNIRDFTEFDWMNVTLGQAGTSVIFNTTFPQLDPYGNNTSGSMSFEFEMNDASGRDSDLPRLIYNANNTQFNFVLDKYVPMFNKSRFALEISIIGNYSDGMRVEDTKSIDDEYSPGVFKVSNWFSGSQKETGYLQWKPVCYLGAGRGRALGTEVMFYDLHKPADTPSLEGLLQQSLATAFFGHAMNETKAVLQRSSNVSFGLSQDGFYVKKNYTVWTATVGYGVAPAEAISTLVIIIIAAGLGLPVILILIGSIYVCVKKSRGDYEEIGSGDDDDGGVSRDNPRLN